MMLFAYVPEILRNDIQHERLFPVD